MYLLLVAAWLIASCIFGYQAWVNPTNSYNALFAGISVVMVAYNLVRWWSVRYMARQRRIPGPPPHRPVVQPDEDEPPLRRE